MSGSGPVHSPLLAALAFALLTASGCLHVRLNTAVAADGGTLRSLDLSVDEEFRPLLMKAHETGGQLVSAPDRWRERTHVEDGRFHRVLTRESHDADGISDRELRSLFGQWIELGPYEEGDAVEFDVYRTLPATTYSFRETFNIRPGAAALTRAREQPLPPVEVRIAVEMPGRLLESPSAARTEGGTATWDFTMAIEDTASFAGQVTVKSGRTHFWHFLLAGILAILFLASLPRQFRR